jgi:hypothetical protein
MRTPEYTGSGGAFMVTRGRYRHQRMNGIDYVVGHGTVTAFDGPDSQREAFAYRDELLAGERGRREQATSDRKATAEQQRHEPAGPGAVSVGAHVAFDVQPGQEAVGEIFEANGRVVRIREHMTGYTYLRKPEAVRALP